MKRSAALALALCVLLTSCGSMLEREYVVSAPHEENRPHREDSYTVETYPALLSALGSYVEAGLSEGTLRFPTTYRGNLTVDLEKARRAILEEDPLGSYALNDLTYSTSRIIAYYETELTFDYRVEPETLPAIGKTATREALQTVVAQTLQKFEGEFVGVVYNYPADDPAYFTTVLRGGYDAVPAAALGMPEMAVELYPEMGTKRLVVLRFTYEGNQAALLQKKSRVELAATRVKNAAEEETPAGLLRALRDVCEYDPEGGATVADALMEHCANAEGMSLAYALVLQTAGIPAKMEWNEGKCTVSIPDGDGKLTVDVTSEGL